MLLAALLLPAALSATAAYEKAQDFAADYDQFASFVQDRYAYFEDKTVEWAAVVEHDRELARAATSVGAFVEVLESSLDELYDPHSHLMTHRASSWRLPSWDLWAEFREGEVRILEVRRGSAAEAAGLQPGMAVTTIDGRSIPQAIAHRHPRFLDTPDPAAEQWALLSALSGQRDRNRVLQISKADGETRRLEIADLEHVSPAPPDLEAERVNEDLLLIRVRSFADPGLVESFDRILKEQRGARGILFDVRDNAGGDTAVARPMMGRLIREAQPYARMARREAAGLGEPWTESVEPRGPWTFEGPVVVLVNHWSTSMAEGFAMGLDGMQRATVVGTRMAGLGAAIGRITLRESGIGVQISTEPVFHLDGSPREDFRPEVLVEPVAGQDLLLDEGMRLLAEQVRGSGR